MATEQIDPVSALMRILNERWVLTLALDDPEADAPYPCPLFYALAEPDTIGRHAAPLLIFTSDPASYHGGLIGSGPAPAAAGVYLETEELGKIRGAQLRGTLVRDDGFGASGAAGLRERYLARHPAAEPMLAEGPHRLYALILTWAKLSDTRVGFGLHPIARFDGACSEVEQSRP